VNARVAATTAAEQQAAREPDNAVAHRVLGMLQLDTGDAARALDSLRRAAFLDPADALAHYGLGRAHAELGETSRAQAALTYARRLLAGRPADEAVPGADGLLVGDLLRVVEAQFLVLERVRGR
jgi:Flp pilus assembly protein TadD